MTFLKSRAKEAIQYHAEWDFFFNVKEEWKDILRFIN